MVFMKNKLYIIILTILILNSCSKTKSTNVKVNEFNEVKDIVSETQQTSNDKIDESYEEEDTESEDEQNLSDELTGTVWIGKEEIKTDEFSGITDIILTFFDEREVEIIEWEIIKGKGFGERYQYKTFDGKNIFIYRYEDSWGSGRRKYRAIINNDVLTLPKWFNGETITFKKRTDLSGREDKIIINSTYYEDSGYYVKMEYKLISKDVHGLNLYVTEGGDSASRGWGIREGMAYEGYNRVILSFPEKKVKEYEADFLRDNIFDYTKTGYFTDKEKNEYIKKYGLPEVSYVWARLFYNYNNKTFAKSNVVKFK